MREKTVYLDYNATTPVDPEVAAVMLPYFAFHFGNPSSIHEYGIRARAAVEEARRRVAAFLNCTPGEIIFTGGGTESNNLAIMGCALARHSEGNHIITSTVEHPAVAEVCRALEGRGFRVSFIPVDTYGTVDLDLLTRAITKETILITVMHANNEVGTIQPIEEIGEIARTHRILFHTDA
ncbi:MAG: aminotransferase class V-fold PLP-dependent enzyme, partial [Deltaproteobacteria bacterium]|nr:aminotransferase class V-fold PLP-dependent enzyme [Deltaproteobacteria bacterium]